MGTNPKLSMMSGECFQNGALDELSYGVTEPGAQFEKERIETPSKMLAAHRMRVYNINPRFLEQRQARAMRRFEVQQESLRNMEEFIAEQAVAEE